CGGQFEFQAASSGGLEKVENGDGTNDTDNTGNHTEIMCDSANEDCVLLCHVPPGNPSARHNILVGQPAVEAHLMNHDSGEDSHDYLGPCLDDETQAAAMFHTQLSPEVDVNNGN
ncbi:MAG TPA: hypothetical protein VFV50_00260, partial [Bdellovibrionales bacterium]|nr:hypothetical protein [Bdellovibrionales bacterium]